MSTLNGVEFNILRKRTTVISNNLVDPIAGSDETMLRHNGYTTEPMVIVGFVYNESEYDDFKEEFYSGEELTLILEESLGVQYIVRGGRGVYEIEGESDKSKNITFMAEFNLKNPYKESTETITLSKTITTQNQEFTADDDSVDIKTNGNVDAVPDIQVTGGIGEHDNITQTVSNSSVDLAGNSIGQTFKPTGAEITEIDIYTGSLTGVYDATLTIYDSSSMTTNYGSDTQTLVADSAITFEFDIDIEEPNSYYLRLTSSTPFCNIRRQNSNVYADGFLYVDENGQTTQDLKFIVRTTNLHTKDVEIYNTSDTTIKCGVTNDMLVGAIHTINVDGTGTIYYEDDFSTSKWNVDSESLNASRDITNNELDIADDGYIYWKKDTKFPVTGTPTLTSRINITSGTPTIQISSDASTWYDIDTAIVDDVETVYPLDSDGNLSLAGKTLFYFRYDCVKAAAATASIKYFELDIDIHTIYAKNPKITKGSSASTFRIDQDTDSGMACIVALILKHRWWL